jgi:hypothetical protein
LIQLRKLTSKTPPILVDSQREVSAELVELIDHASEAPLELRISGVEGLFYVPVVLLPRGLQLSKFSPALQTMLWKRINPESVLFVPDPLLLCAERKFAIATVAHEGRVHVPISGTNGAILLAGIRPHSAAIVDSYESIEEVDGHLTRIVTPKIATHTCSRTLPRAPYRLDRPAGATHALAYATFD